MPFKFNPITGKLDIVDGVGSPPTGFSWNNVTGISVNMAVNNAYIADNVALVTLTLPATAAVGQVVWVIGQGTGLWRIAQNVGQTIHFGNVDSTPGVGGSITATNRYDAIQLVCTVANTDWVCTGVAQGNPNVV